MKTLPKINWLYWLCLCLASVFGANAGDFIAGVLHLGHFGGLPYLIVALAGVFLVEYFVERGSALYFWLAIIIVRASATNVGDIFHDYKIGFAVSVPLTAGLLIGWVLIWRFSRPSDFRLSTIPVNSFYWVSMFIAGVLGTVAGDAASFGIHLGPAYATVALAVPLALLLFFGRKALLTNLYFYWLVVAVIRSAGTAAGDWLAHSLGILGATTLSGLVFSAAVIWVYEVRNGNRRAGA